MKNGLSFVSKAAKLISIKDRLKQSTYLVSMFGDDLSGYHSARHSGESSESAISRGREQLFKDFERGVDFKLAGDQILDITVFKTRTSGDTSPLDNFQNLETLLSEDTRLLPHLPALFQHYNQQVIYGLGANFINVMQTNAMISMFDEGHVQVGLGNETKQFYVGDDDRVYLIIKRQLGFKTTIIGLDNMFHAIDSIEETFVLDDEHGFMIEDIKSSGHPLTTMICNRAMETEMTDDTKNRVSYLMQKSFEAHQQAVARKSEIARLEALLSPILAVTMQQYSHISTIEYMQQSSVFSGGFTAMLGGLLGFCIAGPAGMVAGAAVGGVTGATTSIVAAPVSSLGEYLKRMSKLSHNGQIETFITAHAAEIARYDLLKAEDSLALDGPQFVKEDVIADEPKELLTRLYQSAYDRERSRQSAYDTERSRQFAESYTERNPRKAEEGYGPFAVTLHPL